MQNTFQLSCKKNPLKKWLILEDYISQGDCTFLNAETRYYEMPCLLCRYKLLIFTFLGFITFIIISNILFFESNSLVGTILLTSLCWISMLLLFIYSVERILEFFCWALVGLYFSLNYLEQLDESYCIIIQTLIICLIVDQPLKIIMRQSIPIVLSIILNLNSSSRTILNSDGSTNIDKTKFIHSLGLILLYSLILYKSFQWHTFLQMTTQKNKILDFTMKTRNAYFGSIIHEVRNPLASAINFIEILVKDKKSKTESAQLIQLTQNSCEIAHTMISNYLDIFKLQTNNLQLNLKSHNLYNVAMSTLSLFYGKARNKGLKLILRISKTLPTRARIDSIRFSQMLLNLVGNSIKFTESGSVVIEIYWKRLDGLGTISRQISQEGPLVNDFHTFDLEKNFDNVEKILTTKPFKSYSPPPNKKPLNINKPSIQKLQKDFFKNRSGSLGSSYPELIEAISKKTLREESDDRMLSVGDERKFLKLHPASPTFSLSEFEANQEINELDDEVVSIQIPRRNTPKDRYSILKNFTGCKTERLTRSISTEQRQPRSNHSLYFRTKNIVTEENSINIKGLRNEMKRELRTLDDRNLSSSKIKSKSPENWNAIATLKNRILPFRSQASLFNPHALTPKSKNRLEHALREDSWNRLQQYSSSLYSTSDIANLVKEFQGILYVDVKDTGIGISREQVKNLFRPFAQANSQIFGQYGGTGLGLWFSKKIANIMSGDIEVTSEINKGSTFSIRIPVTFEGFSISTLSNISPMESALDILPNMKEPVLIYEKSSIKIRKFLNLFNKLGCDPIIERKSQKALQTLKTQNCIAVFMEVRKDNKEKQYQFLSQLRKQEELSSSGNIPIILCLKLQFDISLQNKFFPFKVDYLLPSPPKKNNLAGILVGLNHPTFESQGNVTNLSTNHQTTHQRKFKFKSDHRLPEIVESPQNYSHCSASSNQISCMENPESSTNLISSSKFLLNKLLTKKAEEEKETPFQILIIDDEDFARNALERLVQSVPFSKEKTCVIYTSCNGKEGYDEFKKNLGIKLVLTDTNMPKMDGYQCAHKIRNFEKKKSLTPAWIVNLSAGNPDLLQTLGSGINKTFQKPIKAKELNSLLFEIFQAGPPTLPSQNN